MVVLLVILAQITLEEGHAWHENGFIAADTASKTRWWGENWLQKAAFFSNIKNFDIELFCSILTYFAQY